MFFHEPNPKLEDKINKKIDLFLNEIKNNPNLSEFIDVFGITGPAARDQATKKGSDIDFYCITSKLSPFKSINLRNKFIRLFEDVPIEVELLIFSPNIFQKPDLMLFEFSNNGKTLYGKLNKKFKLEQIPKWEAMQLLTYRGGPFFQAYDQKNIDYEYSKLILGLGESILLMDDQYVADNHARYKLILKNKTSKNLNGFLSEYEKAYNFRYKNKSFNEPKSKLYLKGNSFLLKTWKYILTTYFKLNYLNSIKKLKTIKPSFGINLGNHIFYIFNSLRFNKKLKFSLINPYIREILLIQKYLSNTKKYSSLRKEICLSWKSAPRFWKSN